jgi:transcriptional regulator with XRE-family HTH domain
LTTAQAQASTPKKLVAKGETERALGAQFRAVRRRQKCWLLDLSSALKCSVNTIRWHEAGARMMRADMIVRAATVMGVSPDELLIEYVAERQEEQ